GNDVLVCQRSNPTLSSIDLGQVQRGYLAAELLDEMMSGKPKPANPIVMEPLGVVRRGSTDLLSTLEDPRIAAALRYIREHACDPIQVDDVAAKVSMSRRALERQFVQVRGRSPHEEIRRVQLQRATLLLVQTRMSLDQVASASGFSSAEWMNRVFHKDLGLT